MQVSDSSTAAALLAHIPVSSRRAAISDAIDALPQAGSQDLVVISALLKREEDESLVAKAADGLLILLQQERLDDVLVICRSDDRLWGLVLQKVTDQLENSHFLSTPRGIKSNDGPETVDQGVPAIAGLYIIFAKRSLSSRRVALEMKVTLLRVALKVLYSIDKNLSATARGLAFEIVGSSLAKTDVQGLADVHAKLWSTIVDLATSADSSNRTTGYALWLRWWRNQPHSDLKSLCTMEYWDLLARGLRVGDGEQRKCCLAILRLSVATAMDHADLLPLISNKQSANARAIGQQYARYCTVFETIVLGRYLNQVMECEGDLDLLAAPGSGIPTMWLSTLLSASMDPKFQDSNRRFIAQWIFKGRLQPTGAMGEYTALLRQHLLPWATEGRLFTTSLRRVDGMSVCTHGEALAEYVFALLKADSSDAEGTETLLCTFLGFLTHKNRSLFAYAGIYVLEGVNRAFQACPSMTLQPGSLELVLELSAMSGLPEVATYHFQQRCLAACQRTLSTHPAMFDNLSPQSEMRCKPLSRNSRSTQHGQGDKYSAPVSQRDLNERKSIEKCRLLRSDVHLVAADDIESKILDLWSDVEYLEYPKDLLVVMLDALFRSEVIQSAINEETGTIAKVLRDATRRFHKLAESRLYLLSPLIGGVRAAVLADQRAASIFPMEEMVLRIADHPPEPTLDFQLEDATVQLLQRNPGAGEDASYEAFFGKRESYGFAAVLDLVSRMDYVNSTTTQSLLEQLMSPWLAQKAPIPIVSKWKTPLQVQLMLLCTEQYLKRTTPEQTERLLQDFHQLLAIEPLPRYRFLFEWIIARIYVRRVDLRGAILAHLATKDHHSNPKYLASLMKVAVMLALSNGASEGYAHQLANALVALSASSKVIIRHEAQWSFPLLWNYAGEKQWASITGNSSLAALYDYVRSLERYTEPPIDRELGKLNPASGTTLANLAEGWYLDIEPPVAPLARYSDFKALETDDQARSLDLELRQPCIPLGFPVRPTLQPTKAVLADSPAKNEAPQTPPPEIEVPTKPLALQTKGTAYLADSPSTSRPKHDLLVVASLIDNPYNLGGLSRASEIFGASSLHLANPRVTANKDFTAVSVSSHLHIPLQPLAAADLPTFLAQKKVEGFTVVGIEQTDRSVVLGSTDARLPSQKVVLVLGSEKEGIPATVLSECDVLVEIPQVGITRSLNVQTAASIVLFELTRQRII